MRPTQHLSALLHVGQGPDACRPTPTPDLSRHPKHVVSPRPRETNARVTNSPCGSPHPNATRGHMLFISCGCMHMCPRFRNKRVFSAPKRNLLDGNYMASVGNTRFPMPLTYVHVYFLFLSFLRKQNVILHIAQSRTPRLGSTEVEETSCTHDKTAPDVASDYLERATTKLP